MKKLDDNILQQIEDTIGYHFMNRETLNYAFRRKSLEENYCGEDNVGLIFIGREVVRNYYLKETVNNSLGYISHYVGFNVNGSELGYDNLVNEYDGKGLFARYIDELGFAGYLILDNNDEYHKLRENDEIKEELFMAIMGAVAVDTDWDYIFISMVMYNIANLYFDTTEGIKDDIDYLKLICDWSLKASDELPKYEYYVDAEKDYVSQSSVSVELKGLDRKFYGLGISNYKARIKAAKKAYEYLKENNLID